jgi:hypothetical protein
MTQDGRTGKTGEKKGASRAAERAEIAALECRSDWDNPFGHEPSVPIIYEPY